MCELDTIQIEGVNKWKRLKKVSKNPVDKINFELMNTYCCRRSRGEIDRC